MGFFDKFKPKKEEIEKKGATPQGKYAETCSLCGGSGTDKKWMGQYWHKKCLRSVKKQGRKMI